jgi:hypothetical protein
MSLDLHESRVAGPLNDRVAQRSQRDLGEQGDDIDTHGKILTSRSW